MSATRTKWTEGAYRIAAAHGLDAGLGTAARAALNNALVEPLCEYQLLAELTQRALRALDIRDLVDFDNEIDRGTLANAGIDISEELGRPARLETATLGSLIIIDDVCQSCVGRGWAIFDTGNGGAGDETFYEVQACDCGMLDDDGALHAAREAGFTVADDNRISDAEHDRWHREIVQ